VTELEDRLTRIERALFGDDHDPNGDRVGVKLVSKTAIAGGLVKDFLDQDALLKGLMARVKKLEGKTA